MAALRELFRPEFLNRIDDIVMFQPLGKDQIEHIIDLQMQHVVKLLAERKITLKLTPAAKTLLFREGYDPAYGARPMKRAIQRLIQDPLALKLLDGEVQPGDDGHRGRRREDGRNEVRQREGQSRSNRAGQLRI